jgi:hypothetical protein
MQRNTELGHQLKETERNLITRDKVISELRLRMPATADRDEIILRATAKATASTRHPDDDYEMIHALSIAQSTVASLQVCSNGNCAVNPLRTEVFYCHQNQNAKHIGIFFNDY